jgi:hypothetical protein
MKAATFGPQRLSAVLVQPYSVKLFVTEIARTEVDLSGHSWGHVGCFPSKSDNRTSEYYEEKKPIYPAPRTVIGTHTLKVITKTISYPPT